MTFDFLHEVDCETAYMDAATKTLHILAEDMECEMLALQKAGCPASPEWILERCCGFTVIVRELERITDELNAAVTREFQKRKDDGSCPD